MKPLSPLTAARFIKPIDNPHPQLRSARASKSAFVVESGLARQDYQRRRRVFFAQLNLLALTIF